MSRRGGLIVVVIEWHVGIVVHSTCYISTGYLTGGNSSVFHRTTILHFSFHFITIRLGSSSEEFILISFNHFITYFIYLLTNFTYFPIHLTNFTYFIIHLTNFTYLDYFHIPPSSFSYFVIFLPYIG